MPSLVEIGTVFLGNILNFINDFSLFRYYIPLEKGVVLDLWKLEFPLAKDALSKLALVLEKMKMWKIYNDNDYEQWTNCDKKSSLEPSA